MSDENKSIHEFDLNLICEYYSNLERQGPGSPEVTIKALSFIDNLNDKYLITAAQTQGVLQAALMKGLFKRGGFLRKSLAM